MASDTAWELWCKIKRLDKKTRAVIILLIDLLLKYQHKEKE